jgi:hypothetical protein
MWNAFKCFKQDIARAFTGGDEATSGAWGERLPSLLPITNSRRFFTPVLGRATKNKGERAMSDTACRSLPTE